MALSTMSDGNLVDGIRPSEERQRSHEDEAQRRLAARETTAVNSRRRQDAIHQRAVEIFEIRTGLEYGDEHTTSHDWTDAHARAEEEASSNA